MTFVPPAGTANTPPYRWQVLNGILDQLKNSVMFVPQNGDDAGKITEAGIVFRKVSIKQRPMDKGFTMQPVFPGIIVSTPFTEPFNPTDGEVGHDAYVYHFLCQIIDSDNFAPTANIRTYWKWQEQICRLFQFNCFGPYVDAIHVLSNAVNVDVVDETRWLKEENFVAGVHITVQVWMTRGAS